MIKLSDSALASWFEQLADGLEAGMDYVNAVALARPLPKSGSDRLIYELRAGNRWTVAVERAGLRLLPQEMAAQEAGERSGALPMVLRWLAAARAERAQNRRRVTLSLLYPIGLLHLAAVAFPVGYLAEGAATKFAVAAGMVLVPLWLLIGFVYLMGRLAPSAVRGAQNWIPLLGAYRRNADMASLCHTLALCFRAGMPADEAWEAGALAADNPRVDRLGEKAVEAIRERRPVSSAIADAAKRLPGSFLQLYRGGESTGMLEQNLHAAGQAYAREAKGKLLLATMVYSKLVLVAIFGYVAYRIVSFFAEYYQGILDMAATGGL